VSVTSRLGGVVTRQDRSRIETTPVLPNDSMICQTPTVESGAQRYIQGTDDILTMVTTVSIWNCG